MRRLLVVAALVAVSACSAGGSDGSVPLSPGPSSRASASQPSPAATAELVVIGHATRPQLRLSRRAAQRLVAGDLTRWRGRHVVSGRASVERDPDAIAVVPLQAVRPTVTVARVAGHDPVRDHPDAVDVTVVGDLMLVRGVPDAAAALAPMAPRLRAADLTVGNLESTLSTDGRPTQEDAFGGSPALLRPLARAGFDALSLANNHTGDFGGGALLDTVRAFRESGIEAFGAGADARAASRPAYLSAGGVRFALVGFNSIGETPRASTAGPGALSLRMPPRTGPLVAADLRRVERVVRRADRRADVVIALPHWGEQYVHQPWPDQRRVARALVRAGADLVVGGHPHWVQGVDAVGGVPVLHSLGNFVFDMDFMAQTMEGVVLEATFHGAELEAIRLVPYRMDPQSFAPRVLRGRAAAEVLGDVWSASTGPYALR